MDQDAPYSPQPLTGVAAGAPKEKAGARMPVRDAMEHMIAVTYGVTYDAVVTRFPAYEAMVEEVVGFVGRSVSAEATPRSVRVLDVACGIGNVSIRLAREGYSVVGIDGVRHLVEIAREKTAERRATTTFQHLDISRDPVPGAGNFDVLVSMHTLYWHPQPAALLEGCRSALRAGGHAVFLTYGRPASVIRTFRELWAAKGLGAAVRALRWLLPTALFERFRDCEHRYLSTAEFHVALGRAGFEVLEARDTFLSDLSHLAWCRAR